ncbi:MAG TPA: hypothetical protein VHM02_11440 [Thermoanaerobaculia bacterium]|nr:hypothetical protein [Thermoanaerobaculia bacterium]
MKLHLAAWGPRVFAATLALVACAFAGPALAADAASDAPAVRPPLLATPAVPVLAPALQAAIDAETGLFRAPTTGERIVLADLARAAAPLRRVAAAVETVHSDGTVSLELDPSLHSLSQVAIGADGRVHFACGDAGAAHAHAPAPVAPAVEEER